MQELISPYVFSASTRDLNRDIQHAQITQHDPDIAHLAQALMALAQKLDTDRIVADMAREFFGSIHRDIAHPTPFTSAHILGKDWADDPMQPLQDGEMWNLHNRASNTGIRYALDEDGYPVNPFFNYGVKERGVVGRFGPNHAVDIAPCRMMPNKHGQQTLHVLGIIRTDNGDPAFCGGFTTFAKDKNGHYPYRDDVMHMAQTHEFFEELVSGSVELLPRYAKGLDEELEQAIMTHERASGHIVSPARKDMMLRQMITQRKLQQIETEDIGFLRNLYAHIEQATLCFSGPVLSSGRNTNTAWMESRLSWFMLDDKRWNDIKGDDKFGYEFHAGDDAGEVVWHEVTPELLQATASHGPLFCYLMGSLLVNNNHIMPDMRKTLKAQAETLVSVTPTLPLIASVKNVAKYPAPHPSAHPVPRPGPRQP